MSDLQYRALSWIGARDTGVSSKAIWQRMMGVPQVDTWGPADPDDLGRCLRLLRYIPEWAPRMAEMAVVSEEWSRLIPHWAAIAASMADEVGIDWEKARSAPKTYATMVAIRTAPGRDGERVG